MTTICIIIGLLFLCLLCWQNMERIGVDQKREWKQFVRDNPHLFKQPEEPKQ